MTSDSKCPLVFDGKQVSNVLLPITVSLKKLRQRKEQSKINGIKYINS